MGLNPYDWNVVVAGYWNRAILTPAGIARRLFGLEPNIPVMIEVPIDGLAPYRVTHEDLTVTAVMGRLTIYANTPSFKILDSARAIAIREQSKTYLKLH
ncbi:hypothetical protein JXL19_08350 [bacterium]|nr:hypothetical protein [bacterium]